MTRVFTEGVFDLIHANHVIFLQEAAAHGDHLIVGVTSDAAASRFKRVPYIGQEDRLFMVRALKMVDEAFIIEDYPSADLMRRNMAAVRADLVIYGGIGWDDYYAPAKDAGKFKRLPYHTGISTSEILRRIDETRDR